MPQDLADLLLGLAFHLKSPIGSRSAIGQSLQTIRALSPRDVPLLLKWAETLPPEPRAYRIADERLLEDAYERGPSVAEEVIDTQEGGVSAARRAFPKTTNYRRNRLLVTELHRRYQGRCQLCAFAPDVVYGVAANRGHHITYLSRGGADELGNLILLCPNHHEVVRSE